MLEKLDSLEQRYEELGRLIADPEVMNDRQRWQQYVKTHAELEEIVAVYRDYKKVCRDFQEAKELLREKLDPDFRELVEAELETLEEKKEELEHKLKVLLLPRDPNDEKNVIMEIRAGTGGEEAALFAADLFRMYTRYAERQGWKIDLMNTSYTDLGGIKEIIFLIEGKGAYSKLKFESGVHRVQRVPATESGGRIHTSAATVAVLPEAEEVEVEINPNDLRIDVFCSTGPGGQSVNTTQSAVRITHLPTGIVVSCQDEKSQHKNKEKAMRVLRARLLDRLQEEQQQKIASARRSMVGTGDRSERIRTYNFPQNRVTDHRIGLTIHRLEDVLMGELDEIIDALVTTDQARRLQEADSA
ncbi:peptide chain release factor 1 [Desulfofundulus australicus DSM 11792]|jgi:peptide chain release factor 1|uniref:Peptide chain release factor 1 n=1 Tax=Desulfofundulus australicus DSM 11792 TaxID=1121425 RepID=A0A1M4YKS3_9FIRM|nr:MULTISPECIES: peptide chain release factor 1 [Desulfofundulus]MDK2888642.1 peptide chain release factor 1 [Thermoanaerobacter sp.]SHF06369.1 peptide chain release factor 1 [Desulfofundulus australicus DSM 11792]